MLSLRRPDAATIAAVLAAQRALPLDYRDPGGSRAGAIAGYPVNHFRLRLGTGDALYARAVAALRRWAMYDLPWTEVHPRGAPAEAGRDIVVLARHFGFWSLNPCRVAYVDDDAAAGRFSFALGTLPGHSERGEERFRIERRGDEVWLEVLAFAGPRHPLTWLGYPLLRRVQRRFARAAGEAVARAAAGP